MRFHFWEYIFFASAFGAIVFFPVSVPFLPLLHLAGTALVLALTGISAFAAFALHERNREKPTRVRAFAAAAVTGCVALFASVAGQALPPAFVLWSASVILVMFTFGSILARRFFRRVERDFRRNAGHVIVTALAANAAAMLFMLLAAAFPPILIATGVAVITLVALL